MADKKPAKKKPSQKKKSAAKAANLEIVPHGTEKGNELAVVPEKLQRIQELVNLIQQGHDFVVETMGETKAAMLKAANRIRDVGNYLIELKENCPHGKWNGLFKTFRGQTNSQPVVNFSYETGRNYMSFAKAKPEPLQLADMEGKRNVTELLQSTGAIVKKPKTGEKLHPPATISDLFIDLHASFNQTVAAAEKIKPRAEWEPETIAEIKLHLGPIVDLFNAL